MSSYVVSVPQDMDMNTSKKLIQCDLKVGLYLDIIPTFFVIKILSDINTMLKHSLKIKKLGRSFPKESSSTNFFIFINILLYLRYEAFQFYNLFPF